MWRVVIYLDPFGRARQIEQLGHAFQQLCLAGGFGQFSLQRLAGVGLGVQDDRAFLAPLRQADFDLAARLQRQRLGDQRLLR